MKAHHELVEDARRQINEGAFSSPYARENRSAYLKIAGSPLNELAELGYEIDSLDDLRHLGRDWKTALPALLRWLPRIEDLHVKESVVRCLSVPWIGNRATGELIVEFKRYAPVLKHPSNPWDGNKMLEPSEKEKQSYPSFSLAWAIGNALAIVDIRGFERQVVELCSNPEYGAARQMVVLSLYRLGNSEAEDTALHLLSDEEVGLHAVMALGKMKSKRALFELEKLLSDRRPGVPKEARKAITSIRR